MAEAKKTAKEKKFRIEILKQTVALSTAGFGLAAALAWNTLIQEFINVYVKKFLPGGTKLASMLIYAVAVTLLAVAVTYYLSKLASRFDEQS
jgi:hypothetical protein